MSKISLNFLLDSFLYNMDACDCMYSKYTDAEIECELRRYRDFVKTNIRAIREAVNSDCEKMNVSIDTFDDLPDENLYKQLVLYMDQVCIPDPLFKCTEFYSELDDSYMKMMGLYSVDRINRKKIMESVEYIRSISALIQSGFVVMLPISLIHEVGDCVPIKYSENGFSDVIPEKILEYYKSVSSVYNMNIVNGKLEIERNKKLQTNTCICVEFDGDNKTLMGYSLNGVSSKNNTVIFTNSYNITDSEFDIWVNQSINQAANKNYKDISSELVFARQNNCMYLTRKNYISEVLKIGINNTERSRIANMAMKLDLPVSNQVSLDDLLKIRSNYGESFNKFRYELNDRLKKLDTINDDSMIEAELDNIRYELNETEIKRVNDEYRKLIKKDRRDLMIMSGSLIVNLAVGGLTTVGGMALAFANSIVGIKNREEDFRHNNGFFLWKVDEYAKKITT